MPLPLVAITMGDPAGVGPETIAGAWRSPALLSSCRPVVVGHPEVMALAAALLGDLRLEVVEVGSVDEVPASADVMPCLKATADDVLAMPPAKVDPRGGQAAFAALKVAADLALPGKVGAIVTAPLHKAALHAAGHHYPGHTEMLADFCGIPASEVAMMLYLAPGGMIKGPAGLGVAHVTLHMALRDVFANLTQERILASARLADAVMTVFVEQAYYQPHDETQVLFRKSRIGVAALNPHAGEQGLFGDEESRIIAPAVEAGRSEGLDLTGPVPCDTLMVRAAAGEFDAVVAMYHDQGHIALKLLGMHRAVNITLGLPIIRTSVAHGTAFDLAWQGKADSSSMVEAVRVAAQLVAVRERLVWKPGGKFASG
ncbi:MAG TPA: 4-hydroxythreonine-4-phosphate dehydrogenase PdxA [Pirellulaceae bacterium]|nr:4-hydroxythreonine-4-phosphate dehydrogenase PdxA [Pirellulaceae bacterium]